MSQGSNFSLATPAQTSTPSWLPNTPTSLPHPSSMSQGLSLGPLRPRRWRGVRRAWKMPGPVSQSSIAGSEPTSHGWPRLALWSQPLSSKYRQQRPSAKGTLEYFAWRYLASKVSTRVVIPGHWTKQMKARSIRKRKIVKFSPGLTYLWDSCSKTECIIYPMPVVTVSIRVTHDHELSCTPVMSLPDHYYPFSLGGERQPPPRPGRLQGSCVINCQVKDAPPSCFITVLDWSQGGKYRLLSLPGGMSKDLSLEPVLPTLTCYALSSDPQP